MYKFSRGWMVFLAVCVAILSLACGLSGSGAKGVTQTPVVPAATSESVLEETAMPTTASDPEPTAVLPLELSPGETVEVDAGGFSFTSIAELEHDLQGGQVLMASGKEELLVYMLGGVGEDAVDAQDFLDKLLISMQQDIDDFLYEEPFAIEINGITGYAVDIEGILYESAVVGRIAAVIPAPGRFFTVFVLVDAPRWDTDGGTAFDMVVNSVSFYEPVLNLGACPLSEDETYGYSEENPVRVGGDIMEGPARERAYLDTLRGPEGQVLTYERTGSRPYDEVILDMYEVQYAGLENPVTIYIDMYNFETLFAPVDFTCAGEFPLE